MTSLTVLTKNDIIEVQRHCYHVLEDVTIFQDGVEKTLKVGSMIDTNSYFDIHEFARGIEQRILEKLEQQSPNIERE